MFEGPWKIIGAKSLQDTTPGQGEIIKHTSGAVILRCPSCNALQFTHSEIRGADDAPTLLSRIQCGSGFCRRCAIWFGVSAGKTVQYDGEEPRSKTLIPKSLRDAGVKTAPTLPKEE